MSTKSIKTFRSKCAKKLAPAERRIRRFIKPVRTKKWYLRIAIIILFLTTIMWAVLGSQLHSTNADQLADGYMFADGQSLIGARFPGAHSMLLKWPLFWLVGIFGANGLTLSIATVGLAVITVGGLAWLLSRIEKRPVVLGTWYLAMASVLLLVPLQAYSGGLLPVHMAMLTTRNVEYLVYIIGIALVLRSKHWQTSSVFVGTSLLALLIASDHLFMGLGLGGAALMIVFGLLRRNRLVVAPAIRLLGAVAVASLLSAGLFALLDLLRLSQFTTDASPYQLIHTANNGVLGLLYGGLGVLTNFGANPSFDALTVRELLSKGLGRLFSLYGLAYIINAIIVGFVGWQSIKLMRQTPAARTKKSQKAYPLAPLISVALICSALVAFGLFVITTHYYAVDARYLTIWLFAGLIAAVTALHVHPLKDERVACMGLIIAIVLPLGIATAWHSYHAQATAYETIRARDQHVASLLQQHNITHLVGDYWRVLPIRAADKQALTVAPLGSCTSYRDSLTSLSWQKGLDHTRVALLLSLQKGLTDFPACTQAQMMAQFGEPSSTLLVAGSASSPTELLLIYDRGFRHSSPVPPLTDETSPVCENKTIVQVVAHPDDDLLFFSPDLLHDVKAGACIRTVYMTAGDSGGNTHYWRERQAGIRDAYNAMLGQDYVWSGRNVRLSGGQQIQVDMPEGNTNIALIFMNLPDGNQRGAGYASTGNQSLQKLQNGSINTMLTVDSHSAYTSPQLVSGIMQLYQYYSPAEVRTFAGIRPDHSDHFAAAKYARAALAQYDKTPSLQTYIGYAVHDMPENVEGDDFTAKETAFLRYTAHDPATCSDAETCFQRTVYGSYLARQYRSEYEATVR